jgi:hypothetical protein
MTLPQSTRITVEERDARVQKILELFPDYLAYAWLDTLKNEDDLPSGIAEENAKALICAFWAAARLVIAELLRRDYGTSLTAAAADGAAQKPGYRA